MGKLKKKYQKKVNPEKSNKLIYAVAVGLLVVFSLFFILITKEKQPENKEELLKNSLDYLQKVNGIIDLKILSSENKIVIVYDNNIKNDFKRIAIFAGLKVSRRLRKERIEVVLARVKETDMVYSFIFENNTLLKEKLLIDSHPEN